MDPSTATATAFAPTIVGIGGTPRPGSSSETALRAALAAAGHLGARTRCFAGSDLVLPLYAPGVEDRTDEARALVDAVRSADGLILCSPGYHGSVSGLVKNALDYTEDLAGDPRPYIDGLPVGCIGVAFGAQGAVSTLVALRSVVHALRGFPTPYGVAIDASRPVFDGGACADDRVAASLQLVGTQVADLARRLGRPGVDRPGASAS